MIDPKLFLMLATGTLLLLNGLIGVRFAPRGEAMEGGLSPAPPAPDHAHDNTHDNTHDA
jgi:hypothetical protein